MIGQGILIFALTAARIFLLAFQTLNVVGGHYLAAAGVTWGLALSDLGFVILSVRMGWWALPWIGGGGTVGVIGAMWTHGRFF